MGAISYDNFVGTPKFKGFETFDEDAQALIEQMLDEAEQDINEDYYLTKTVRAIMLLAAHKYELSPAKISIEALAAGKTADTRLSGVGVLSSISVSHGSNSASFTPYKGEGRKEYLSRTAWGQELLEIQRTLPVLGSVW
jgi:hypothetical protein